MRKRNYASMLTRIVTLLIMSNFLLIPSIYAEGINVDGDIVESEWVIFYKDELYNPVFSMYTASNLDNVYLGVILEGDIDPDDVILELAFRAKNCDYWIRIKDGMVMFRASGGSWEGWWQHIQFGLPPGIILAIGDTNGDTSYEFGFSKEIMGGYVDDFPNKLKVWLKIVREGETNFYPEMYAEWWFKVEQDEDREHIARAPVFEDTEIIEPEVIEPENPEPEELPKFSVPELPFGTMLSIIMMVAALIIASKKPLPHKL